VATWLIEAHGVALIPGSSCGAPGFVRAAFGNMEGDACVDAAGRLRRGVEELVAWAERGEDGVPPVLG